MARSPFFLVEGLYEIAEASDSIAVGCAAFDAIRDGGPITQVDGKVIAA
jgi:hypothetical protein